ncbi:MAG: gamma-glutamyltransferase [Gomphosphaeria aponina SAG 52.96 = DSM 107014]|uniref:Glutathione hydrolase proenzyme n=1 Tax=Gomphosphaeria aponina SAG 52.96 = DSM 107014 TaxID=1521640 RepID=A0A941JSE8_9CHRO|nr:gamma-glutamyltransferase [Gomphosphaeria aponina SAG 52.96 = DSM 107014]
MNQKTRGAIAAGHHLTVAAGQEMFNLGGNAFDAAIAAILASFVVESTLTSAAGGGFFLAHTQEKQNILFDFFPNTPLKKRPLDELNFYPVELNFGGELQTFHIGLGSMAIPSNIAGIFAVHKKLGKLPFQIVAEPAIEYAKNGFIINNYQSFCLKLLAPILQAFPATRQVYAPDGELLTAGQTCYMPDFAATLTYLVEQGVGEFYQGEIAHQLVKDCQEKGGYLTKKDLTKYEVFVRKPLKINYRGYELVTNPPPSSGGILIAFALKLIEKIELGKIQFGSGEHLQILVEVMQLTNLARKNSYDSCVYEADITEKFLAQEIVGQYQEQLNKWGSTTQISVLDSEGNAASVTTSNGEGSSYMIPGTGIMVNNMLGEADLNPFGFHQWKCNQRISSMMSPTIVLKEGKPEIVLGSGGSNRIRTAILQVISNIIDFQMPLTIAVQSPRVHWENNVFSVEPTLAAINKLVLPPATKVVLWKEKNMFFGGVNAVTEKEAVGDERREGAGEKIGK